MKYTIFEIARAKEFVYKRYPNADKEFKNKKILKCLEVCKNE